MSHRGSTLVRMNGYDLGVGPHGQHRLGMHRLGDDAPVDYGIAAREAAASKRAEQAMQSQQDAQDKAQYLYERQQALAIAQQESDKAQVAAGNILVAGSNQMRRLTPVLGLVSALALAAVAVAAIFGGKKSREPRRRRSRSRRKPKSFSRRSSSIQATAPELALP